MDQYSEDELINIAQEVFRRDKLEIRVEKKIDGFYAVLSGENNYDPSDYAGPAPSKVLAAFWAEQKYIVIDGPTDKNNLPFMPGDTFLEKAQNRIDYLLKYGDIPSNKLPKYKSELN